MLKVGFTIRRIDTFKRVVKRVTSVFAGCALAAALVPAGAFALEDVESHTFSDPLAESEYNYYLTNEDFSTAFGVSGEASGVTVAVIDTGISMPESERPEDLANTVDYEHAWDCSGDKNEPLSSSYVDEDGHGTKVAYVLGSQVDNELGGAGSSYNANILPINVYDETGKADVDSLVRAYRHIFKVAEELNIKVVNLSLGANASTFNDRELAAMKRLQTCINIAYNDYGILTVASAGNYAKGDTTSSLFYMYPAALDNVLAVSAVDKTSTVLSTSYYNEYVDVCAAGSSIYFTEAYEDEDGVVVEATKASGTSYAAAVVSGVAALMYNVNPELTAIQAESILKNTCIDLGVDGYDYKYGNGLVCAGHAAYVAHLTYASLVEGAQYSIARHAAGAAQVATAATYFNNGKIFYYCPDCGYEFTLKTTDMQKLATPQNVSRSSATAAKAVITWDSVDDATSYEIAYRVSGKAAWSTVTVDATKSPSATLKKLKASTKYEVKVRAIVEQGSQVAYSSFSGIIEFKTKSKSA